jgi:hypothetical protein
MTPVTRKEAVRLIISKKKKITLDIRTIFEFIYKMLARGKVDRSALDSPLGSIGGDWFDKISHELFLFTVGPVLTRPGVISSLLSHQYISATTQK